MAPFSSLIVQLCLLLLAPPSQAASGSGAHLDESHLERRSRPVVCSGADSVRLSNVLLDAGATATAINATGSCTLTIRNSRIVGRLGIDAAGSATLSVDNCIVEGQTAIRLADTATLTIGSSTIHGPVKRSGAIVLQDRGGNDWRASEPGRGAELGRPGEPRRDTGVRPDSRP